MSKDKVTKKVDSIYSNRWLASVCAAVTLASSVTLAQTVPDTAMPPTTSSTSVKAAAEPTESRLHRLDVRLFSFIPGEGIKSVIDPSGSGVMITGVGGMVGPAYSDDERIFSVHVRPLLQEGRFVANVELKPFRTDTVIQAKSFEVDLDDMMAESVELARAPDGRVYVLTIVPSVEIKRVEAPKAVGSAANLMEDLQFKNSPVVLDEDEYVGTILGMSAKKVFIDLPGVTKVTFSLTKFAGAEVMGSLDNGQIRLKPGNGHVLDIYGTRSGTGEVLADGPYEVWGNWEEPKMTKEESVAKVLNHIEEQKAAGNPMIDEPGVEEVIERLKKGKPTMSYGGSS